MHFEEDSHFLKLGEHAGFATAYLMFTGILFLILSFFQKLPAGWTLVHLAGATALVTAAGIIVRRML